MHSIIACKRDKRKPTFQFEMQHYTEVKIFSKSENTETRIPCREFNRQALLGKHESASIISSSVSQYQEIDTATTFN